ncbi:unnamed protein product [Ectocarpus sp. CCAP 1310/34]|nr:unnamed protein product [Ectocarpus sp. CCAP 1310/34]
MDTPTEEGSDSPARGAVSEEQEFLRWLRSHGAVIDCVEWPSSETESGVRGAVARRDIAPGDHMVIIPHALMMSEFHAKADPKYGHVHRLNTRLLGSDNGLALYIMQEILKEERSFYWPYLRMLPTPCNLRNWNRESLLLLQDHKLVRRTAARGRQLLALYRETIEFLSSSYPDLYTVSRRFDFWHPESRLLRLRVWCIYPCAPCADRYTFELFDFAWTTIQARAFGKRLKSSALVPFADCLNHGNVQTKYDFDVERNGTFRLFPSGNNRYPRNSEVLNSYGRRANDNLLLDYGFAMLDNEWDTAEVTCFLPPSHGQSPLDRRRKACLLASGQHTVRMLRVHRDVWPEELLRFCRCACLTAPELDNLEARGGQQATMASQSTPSDAMRQRGIAGTVEPTAAAVPPYQDLCRCALRSSKQATRGKAEGGSGSGGSGDRTSTRGTTAAPPSSSLPSCGKAREDTINNNHNIGDDDTLREGLSVHASKCTLPLRDEHEEGNGDRGDRGAGAGAEEEGQQDGDDPSGAGGAGGKRGGVDSPDENLDASGCRFPCRALTAQNEVAALTEAVKYLAQARDNYPTTLEYDEAKRLPGSTNITGLLTGAGNSINLPNHGQADSSAATRDGRSSDCDIAAVRDQFQSSDENGEGVGHENGPSMVSAPVSSSRLDHLLAPPPSPPSRLSSPPLSTRASSTTGGGIENECHQHHLQSPRFSLATGIDSPSFVSYLADVESVIVYKREAASAAAAAYHPE